MSASLTWALTCGALMLVRVMKPLVLVVLVVLLLLVEPTGPPLIHWPAAPLRLATTPSVGATSVAAARLFCAVCRADWALATWALAASRSACVGPAVL